MAFYQLSSLEVREEDCRAVFNVYGAGQGPKNYGNHIALLKSDFKVEWDRHTLEQEAGHIKSQMDDSFAYQRVALETQLNEFNRALKQMGNIEEDIALRKRVTQRKEKRSSCQIVTRMKRYFGLGSPSS